MKYYLSFRLFRLAFWIIFVLFIPLFQLLLIFFLRLVLNRCVLLEELTLPMTILTLKRIPILEFFRLRSNERTHFINKFLLKMIIMTINTQYFAFILKTMSLFALQTVISSLIILNSIIIVIPTIPCRSHY